MKLNKKILLAVFGFILLISLVNPCIAIMMKKTEVTETFQKGIVSCAVHESLDKNKISQTDAKIFGDEVSKITVENTGNVGVYIRVKLISYWENSDGKLGFKFRYPKLDRRFRKHLLLQIGPKIRAKHSFPM